MTSMRTMRMTRPEEEERDTEGTTMTMISPVSRSMVACPNFAARPFTSAGDLDAGEQTAPTAARRHFEVALEDD